MKHTLIHIIVACLFIPSLAIAVNRADSIVIPNCHQLPKGKWELAQVYSDNFMLCPCKVAANKWEISTQVKYLFGERSQKVDCYTYFNKLDDNIYKLELFVNKGSYRCFLTIYTDIGYAYFLVTPNTKGSLLPFEIKQLQSECLRLITNNKQQILTVTPCLLYNGDRSGALGERPLSGVIMDSLCISDLPIKLVKR